MPPSILIAGIGGASLGTELLKCLELAKGYRIFGCDISPQAYGHFQEGFERTYCIDRNRYIEEVMEICRAQAVRVIIPGGERPLELLRAAADRLSSENVLLAGNTPEVIDLCSDKSKTFKALLARGISVPETRLVLREADLQGMQFPCIVKPATNSGGSSFVFYAAGHDDALTYVTYLMRAGRAAIVQQYLTDAEGEFTVGVLSLPDGRLIGSIALRRLLDSKLSCLTRAPGVISTGYSQGLIDDFPEVRKTAETIAMAIGSRGPLNIQGRVIDGVLVPYEINPRFSASTYLRALAAFNEVDMFISHLLTGVVPVPPQPRPGYYLRSLTEKYVPARQLGA